MVVEVDKVSMLVERLLNLQRLGCEGAGVSSLSIKTWEQIQEEIDNKVSKEQDKRRRILLRPIICYERKR